MPFDSRDLLARTISLSEDQSGTLLEVNVPMDEKWLFYFEETSGLGSGSIEIQTGVQLFNLSYTVDFGPKTGDYITGQGPARFVVSCDGFTGSSCLVKGYLSKEGSFPTQVGQLVSTISVSTASYSTIGPNSGFIPAPYNRYTLISNADANGLDLRFEDFGGVVQGSYQDVLQDGKPLGPMIYPLPFALSARANTTSARVSIVYYRE
jgi:hypothetical protein